MNRLNKEKIGAIVKGLLIYGLSGILKTGLLEKYNSIHSFGGIISLFTDGEFIYMQSDAKTYTTPHGFYFIKTTLGNFKIK